MAVYSTCYALERGETAVQLTGCLSARVEEQGGSNAQQLGATTATFHTSHTSHTPHTWRACAQIEVNLPRKRGAALAGYDKAWTKFLEAVLQAVIRHVDFSIVKCLVIAGPG